MSANWTLQCLQLKQFCVLSHIFVVLSHTFGVLSHIFGVLSHIFGVWYFHILCVEFCHTPVCKVYTYSIKRRGQNSVSFGIIVFVFAFVFAFVIVFVFAFVFAFVIVFVQCPPLDRGECPLAPELVR